MNITLSTYAELKEWCDRWERKYSPFIVIESDGGLGKTSTIRSMLKGKRYHYFSSHITPVAMFIELANHPDLPIVFDDVDTLCNNDVVVSLLKQLCETRREKLVKWTSTTKLLDETPTAFICTSNVIVLCNRLKRGNENMTALLDRGEHLYFKPTKKEVLKYTEKVMPHFEFNVPISNAEREKVFRYFKSVVERTRNRLSVRDFVHSLEDYAFARDKGRDWKKAIKHRVGISNAEDKLIEVLRYIVENKIRYPDNVTYYKEKTGKGRTALYSDMKKYACEI